MGTEGSIEQAGYKTLTWGVRERLLLRQKNQTNRRNTNLTHGKCQVEENRSPTLGPTATEVATEATMMEAMRIPIPVAVVTTTPAVDTASTTVERAAPSHPAVSSTARATTTTRAPPPPRTSRGPRRAKILLNPS